MQHEDEAEDTSKPDSETSTTWKDLYAFTTKAHLLALVPGLLFAICAGILEPVIPIFLGKFFDAFADFGAGKISSDKLMDQTLTSVYALLGVGCGTWILKGGMFATWLAFGEMQAKSAREELFQCLLYKDIEWFEIGDTSVEAMLTTLQSQIRELQLGTSQPMGFVVQSIVEGLSALGLSLFYSWRLTLVILSTVPVSAVIVHLLSRSIQPNIALHISALALASETANQAITNISLLKYFNTKHQEQKSYVAGVHAAAKRYLKVARASAFQMSFVTFSATVMFVQGFWYGGRLVHQHSTTPGKVITTFWAALMAIHAFQDILPHVIVLAKGQAASTTLRSLLDSVRSQEPPRKKHENSARFCEGDVEVVGVSFAYPSRPDQMVLHPSTFFFPAGQTTFLVGKSGSGKSTIGNLLVRFYSPRRGQIVVDGRNIANIDIAWLRNNITLVQQQTFLFNETIRTNIAFGHQQPHRVTNQEIEICIDLASLRDTIARLPQGVNTMVGSGGSALSGGQKQRIAAARARLRDTPILILDESTSALDNVSRTSVVEGIRKWRANKTTIIITHDLTMIQNRDYVYMLEDGHLIAEGYRENISEQLEHHAPTGTKRDPLSAPPAGGAPTNPKDRHNTGRDLQQPNALDGHVPPTHRMRKTPNQSNIRTDSFKKKASAQADIAEPSAGIRRRVSKSVRSYMSKHLSLEAALLFEGLEDPNSTEKQSVDPRAPSSQNYRTTRPYHANGRITGMSMRPMSMHQSLVMQSLYTNRLKDKSLPNPQFPGVSQLTRQLSRNRRFKELNESEVADQLSLQEILKTVWPNMDKRSRLMLILGLLAAGVHAGVPPVFAYVLVHLFKTFYILHNYEHKALIYSLSLLLVAFVDGLASLAMRYCLESAAQSWVDNLRITAIRRIFSQPRSYFDSERNSSSILTSSLDHHAEEMRNLVGRFSALILTVIIMMVITIIWALTTCWKLTLLTFGTAPFLYGLTTAFDRVSSHYENLANTHSEKIGLIFTEAFSDIRTVRSLTLEFHFHRKLIIATTSCFRTGVHRALISGLLFGLSDSALSFITALIFYFGAYLAKHHAYSTESILQAFSLLTFSTAAANGIIAYMPQIASSIDTASRLLRLVRLPTNKSHESSGHIALSSSSPTTLTEPIHFINLTFTYPTRPQTPALHNLNLTILPSICTAIVGPSGSGKSTLASLLMGLYPVPSGPPTLTISGRDIRTLHLPTLRSLMAIVPQTPTLLRASVRENIIYGLPPTSPLASQSNIESAALQAGIHDFILTLPQQYDTRIGDGGLGVSGGQAQRIMIARALVRRPRVLILDEATSALDGESAGVVRRSIQALVEEGRKNGGSGRGGAMTVIIITHAREMMEFADWVVVMDEGRKVEEGEYSELLGRRGRLWEMLMGGRDLE